jgi:electron transfer flavoprotein beta subunit
MKIVVCVKQVPDTEARLRVARDGRWIDEEDVAFVLNESDEYALEEALRIAEKLGGEVVVLSLGPERVREALRKTLALGASRAILLRHEAFAGGDALATGRALAAAVKRENPDLVLTGSQSDDQGFGATGTILAGELGWPHAWLVMGVEVEEGGALKVTREMESGLNELFRVRPPAVLEIQAGINHPRYASLKGIMAAKKKEIRAVVPGALPPARTRIVSLDVPRKTKETQLIPGAPAEAAKTLVHKLKDEARVL